MFSIPENYKNNNPKIMEEVGKDINSNSEFHYLFLGAGSVGKRDFALHVSTYLQSPMIVHTLELIDKLSKSYSYYDKEKQDASSFVDKCKFANNLILVGLGKELLVHRDAGKLMGAFLMYRMGFVERDKSLYPGKYYGTPHTIITTDVGFRPSDYFIEDGEQKRTPASKIVQDVYGYEVLNSFYKNFKFMVFANVKSVVPNTVRIIDETGEV